MPGIFAKLGHRIQSDSFNVFGTLIFVAAIAHTFLAAKLMHIAHGLEHQFHHLEEAEKRAPTDDQISKRRDHLQFRAQLFHFLGEVEAVFGIWLIPLFLAILLFKGWPTLVGYASSVNAAEPVFVVVVLAVPVLVRCCSSQKGVWPKLPVWEGRRSLHGG